MKDEDKTKAQLITELVELRQLIADLKASKAEQKHAEKALQDSEKRLSQIVQGSTIPTFVIDDKHIITHWNKACENLTGIFANEVIGTKKKWMPFYHAERPALADFIVVNAPEEEIARYYGSKYRKSNVIQGAYEAEDFFSDLGKSGKWLFFTAAALRNVEGKITGAIETLQDITDRKLAEKALEKAHDELEQRVRKRTSELTAANRKLQQEISERKRAEQRHHESKETLNAILATSPIGIGFVRNRVIQWVNETMCNITGYERGALKGKTASMLYPNAEEYERVGRELPGGTGKSSESAYVDTRWIRENGTIIDCELRARFLDPLDPSKGEIVAAMDITKRKLAEKKLKQTLAELKRSNAELEQFAYVASHDLQEPLRKIQAFGDRLKAKYGNALNDRGSDYLKRMQNAAKRMQTLINDLLTFSRVSTRTQPFTQVDLSNVVQKTLSNLETFIEQTEGCVEVGNLPTIDADLTQMHQLMQNLISNALKFHRKEEAPFVKIHGQLIKRQEQQLAGVLPADEYCQIVVEDNGIGFDEKYLDRIFGVFQRLHGRGDYEGTGIGLANCRKIVERHSGSITAKSTPEKGSTFIVTLPVKQPKQ